VRNRLTKSTQEQTNISLLSSRQKKNKKKKKT
jgi:hypothetical protein